MKKLVSFFTMVFIAITFIFVSCNKNEIPKEIDTDSTEILGTSEFLANLSYIKPTLTKSGEITEDDAREMIASALEVSISYLEENNYDVSEVFSLDDPRIIWVATGLAEYDKMYGLETRTTVGGCILEAIGVNELVKSSEKKVAKAIAKQVVKKAIPYIGAALTAIDFIWCVVEE